MLEIYLLRHGETEWNAEGRYQGASDSPLTPLGREQARRMGRLLAARRRGLPTLDFHVSPLGRARETAALICAETPCRSLVVEPRLREVSLGSWDGLTDVDISARWPDALRGDTAFNWFFRSPDGEGYDQATKRVRDWFGGLQGTIVAVSHGLFSRLVRGVYLGLGREEALALPVAQGVVWRLSEGAVEEIFDDQHGLNRVVQTPLS